MTRVVAALLALLVVLATTTACAAPSPTPDPARVVHVLNESPRAVMVSTSSMLADTGSTTAARPCGGAVSLALTARDFQDDGRLMVFLGVDESGVFDADVAAWSGDPAAMTRRYGMSPIWSDGTLADRLPVSITVLPDLRVSLGPGSGPHAGETLGPGSAPPGSARCVPAR